MMEAYIFGALIAGVYLLYGLGYSLSWAARWPWRKDAKAPLWSIVLVMLCWPFFRGWNDGGA